MNSCNSKIDVFLNFKALIFLIFIFLQNKMKRIRIREGNCMSHLLSGNTINSLRHVIDVDANTFCAMKDNICILPFQEIYWNEINCGIKINVRRKINA